MTLSPLLMYAAWVSTTGIVAEICQSPGCAQLGNELRDFSAHLHYLNDTAGVLKGAMDVTIDPCKDFYHFACGGLLKNITIPDDEAQFGVTEIIDQIIRKNLKTVLESKSIEGLPRSFQKATDFFHSCTDEETLEKNSIKHMRKRLKLYGGWPVLEANWKEEHFDWITLTQTLNQAGQYNDQIFALYVDISPVNTSLRVLNVDSAYHTISIRHLMAGLDDQVTRTYYDVMVNISVEFGACRKRAERELLESLEFEIQLLNITVADSTASSESTLMHVSELQEKYPYIPWLSYIRSVIGNGIEITDEEIVYVANPSYFDKLGVLIQTTPKRVLANHILSQVIFTSRENFNRRILEISEVLTKIRFGKTAPPPRWEFCLGKLFNQMYEILAAVYVRKYFGPESKQKAIDIAKVFMTEFSTLIASEEWMDQETRSRALDKVNSIKYNIGYPDELLNDTIVDEYHRKLKTNRYDLYGNTLNIWKWIKSRSNIKLRQLVNVTSWEAETLQYVTLANGNYNKEYNKIDVLAAVLQRNFFAVDRPDFLNIATLSTVIGHELTHSIDNTGRLFSKDGKMENWWTNATDSAFRKKAQAIIDEYSTYLVKEVNLKLNGKAIQGEVIADHGGYKIAHLGMEAWLSAHSDEDPRLPGLEQYGPRQFFWLAAAATWCTKERVEFIRTTVEDNEHPPTEFRVNGPFRHSSQFAAEWPCPEDSYMNPKYKVNVW